MFLRGQTHRLIGESIIRKQSVSKATAKNGLVFVCLYGPPVTDTKGGSAGRLRRRLFKHLWERLWDLWEI